MAGTWDSSFTVLGSETRSTGAGVVEAISRVGTDTRVLTGSEIAWTGQLTVNTDKTICAVTSVQKGYFVETKAFGNNPIQKSKLL